MLNPGFFRHRAVLIAPMSVLRSLMRLMLCVALILNGSVQALAGDAMHASGHTPGHAAAKAGFQHAAPGCHDPSGTHDGARADHADGHAHPHGEQDSDCCSSSNACDCACQQHSPVATCQVAVLVAAPGDTRVILPAKTGHASPSPARSIRPPIA